MIPEWATYESQLRRYAEFPPLPDEDDEQESNSCDCYVTQTTETADNGRSGVL